jgi:hypothetical protein
MKMERKRRIRKGGRGYEGECENEEDLMKMKRRRESEKEDKIVKENPTMKKTR